jgi:diphosphomevalonate decarboxylase
MSEAVALAHPNFALSKYWGKRGGPGNFPAVPSLSITVAGLATRTRVRFDASRSADRVVLDGHEANGSTRTRVVDLLDRVRGAAGEHRFAEVVSRSDFPVASGLASSASGFAALALAAVHALGLGWDDARVSDLARRSSVSAARSVFGGFVELAEGAPGAAEDALHAATPLAPGGHLPLGVLVAVASEDRKAVGSTDGMRLTLDRSPYAGAWLAEAPKLHARLRQALLERDFARVGELSESSALAMHATAIAAGVLYWNGATVAVLHAARRLREAGIGAYATVDAGPHVKVLVRPDDVEHVAAVLRVTAGVLRVVEGRIGEGARLLPLGTAP